MLDKKKLKQVILLSFWFFIGICLLAPAAMTFDKVNEMSKKLQATEEKLSDTEELVDFFVIEHEQIILTAARQSEQIAILEEAVSPADKRWAKIKKVRQEVLFIIKREGYHGFPNVNALTAYAGAVVDYSEQYDVPISLILAITTQELAFNTTAVSHAGAQGLMQLMPDTARECANDVNKNFYSIFKVQDNVQLGSWYLAKMLNIFNGDVELAIRAYNAGPVYVKRVLSGELTDFPKETINYHKRVMGFREYYVSVGL